MSRIIIEQDDGRVWRWAIRTGVVCMLICTAASYRTWQIYPAAEEMQGEAGHLPEGQALFTLLAAAAATIATGLVLIVVFRRHKVVVAGAGAIMIVLTAGLCVYLFWLYVWPLLRAVRAMG